GERVPAHPRRGPVRGRVADLLRRLHGDERPAERRPEAGRARRRPRGGGLGHLAVQYAKALGLETFAITGREDKRAELRGLGADEVLVAGDDPGKALNDAGGADIVLSTTNSAKQIGS